MELFIKNARYSLYFVRRCFFAENSIIEKEAFLSR
jgi:hypothetical protein